jgi:uncharacterized coiled-coil DUF342 family protein
LKLKPSRLKLKTRQKPSQINADTEKRSNRLSKKQEEKELNDRISLLREQTRRVEAEAEKWAEKRSRLNDRFKTTREEIVALKNERDMANRKVKELKLKREEAQTRINQKIQELKSLRTKIRETAKKKPASARQSLQRQFDSLEWKIQTTPLSLDEEKQLVEQVKRVEPQLNIYKKLEHIRETTLNVETEIKTLQAQAQSCHKALTEIAQKSQELHQRMLSRIEESKTIKAESDRLHQSYLEAKQEKRTIQQEIIVTLEQARQKRQEILQEEQWNQKQAEENLRGKIERQATEKLKRRQKLTWEEFQILAEKGIDTQEKSE